jgi:hypothetical protein
MASLFNKLIDNVVGRSSMERTRDLRTQAIDAMYDPTMLNPLVERSKAKAVEGMDEGVKQEARRDAMRSLFRPVDSSFTGGNAARAMAMSNMQMMQGNQAMGRMETSFALQDQQIKDQYADQYTNLQTQQSQLIGQRTAGKLNESALFNEELSARRRQLGSTVAGLAVDVGLLAATGGFSAAAKTAPQRALTFGNLSNPKIPIPQFEIPGLTTAGFRFGRGQ